MREAPVRSLPLEGSQHVGIASAVPFCVVFAHYPWRDRNPPPRRLASSTRWFAHYPWRDRNTASFSEAVSKTCAKLGFAHYPWRDRNAMTWEDYVHAVQVRSLPLEGSQPPAEAERLARAEVRSLPLEGSQRG